MLNRSVWSWPLLIPIAALHGCGPPADGTPFDGAANTARGTGGSSPTSTAAPATSNTSSSAPASGTPTAPAPNNPALGNEQVGALPVAPVASGGTGGAPAATPPVPAPPPPPPAAAPPSAAELDPLECASYETGFLPLVHEPVCSSCHTDGGGLPRFEPFAQAQSRCAQIGREVASGDMPPNGRLSADQLAVVASWVSLGCPETAEDAAPLCAAAPPGNPGATPPPPPAAGGGDDGDDDDGGGDDDDDDDDDGGDDDDDGGDDD